MFAAKGRNDRYAVPERIFDPKNPRASKAMSPRCAPARGALQGTLLRPGFQMAKHQRQRDHREEQAKTVEHRCVRRPGEIDDAACERR